jgi:cbb3-type cytochrome oxidase subunit 1
MWRAVNAQGQLANPVFLDIVRRLSPFFWLRLAGGGLFFVGMLMIGWNLIRTIAGGAPRSQPVPAPAAA